MEVESIIETVEQPQVTVVVVAQAAPVEAAVAPVAQMDDIDLTKMKLFDLAYDKIKALIRQKEFSMANWFSLVPLAMELAEACGTLKGSEKKALVIDVITKLIMEIPMSEADRAILRSVVSASLPLMIDVIVSSSLQELAINIAEEIHEQAQSCFALCAPKKKSKAITTKSRVCRYH